MPLKITLKPDERIAINGAVLRNGERRASFLIENQARILREQDIMQADEATTPAKRIYFPVMAMYLDPSNRAKLHGAFAARLGEFLGAVTDRDAQNTCLSIAASIANDDYYRALTGCRRLIDFEAMHLPPVDDAEILAAGEAAPAIPSPDQRRKA